jgi:hypothetical protein
MEEGGGGYQSWIMRNNIQWSSNNEFTTNLTSVICDLGVLKANNSLYTGCAFTYLFTFAVTVHRFMIFEIWTKAVTILVTAQVTNNFRVNIFLKYFICQLHLIVYTVTISWNKAVIVPCLIALVQYNWQLGCLRIHERPLLQPQENMPFIRRSIKFYASTRLTTQILLSPLWLPTLFTNINTLIVEHGESDWHIILCFQISLALVKNQQLHS